MHGLSRFSGRLICYVSAIVIGRLEVHGNGKTMQQYGKIRSADNEDIKIHLDDAAVFRADGDLVSCADGHCLVCTSNDFFFLILGDDGNIHVTVPR